MAGKLWSVRLLFYSKKMFENLIKRKCCNCWKLLELNMNNFYRDKSNKYWYWYRCKKCESKRTKKRKINRYTHRLNTNEIFVWFIYLVECNWYYKIWSTKNKSFKKRIETLQTWNPYKLKLYKMFKVTDRFYFENQLHIKFKDKNIRWERFILDEKDIEYIDEYLTY